MTKTEFKQWQMLVKQYKNGYHLSVTEATKEKIMNIKIYITVIVAMMLFANLG